MESTYLHITVGRDQDIYIARLRRHRLEESDILHFADEMISLIDKEGCRRLILSLGPGRIDCLYSIFLAKLVMIQRHLAEIGGAFRICDAAPETLEVFEACRLKDYFDFCPDQASAIAAFAGK